MNVNDIFINEDLSIDSGDKQLNKIFRSYIIAIFSNKFLSKIDRIFDMVLKFKDFKERSNVVCYTQGMKIYINRPFFDSLTYNKKMKYLIHEFIHFLENSGKFPEISELERKLANIVSREVPRSEISTFLTGKKQNIHSDWRKETLTYLANNSINWNVPKRDIKDQYYKELKDSEIFNLNSYYWKKRFDKI